MEDGPTPDTGECITYITPDIPADVATRIEATTGVTKGEILMVTKGDACPTVSTASSEPCDKPVTPSKLVLYNETTTIYLTNGDVVVGEGQSLFESIRDECGHHTENIFIGKFNIVPTSATKGEIQTEISGEVQDGKMVVQADFYVLSHEFEMYYNAEIVASTEEGVFVSLKSEDGKLSQSIFMDGDGTLNKINQYTENETKEYTFFYENGKITKAVEYDEDGNEITIFYYNEEGTIESYEELENSEGHEGQTAVASIENDVEDEPISLFFDVKGEDPNADGGGNGNGGGVNGSDSQAEIKVPPSCSTNKFNQTPQTSPILIAAMLGVIGGKKIMDWIRSL